MTIHEKIEKAAKEYPSNVSGNNPGAAAFRKAVTLLLPDYERMQKVLSRLQKINSDNRLDVYETICLFRDEIETIKDLL